MTYLDDIKVDITVVLGRLRLPLQRLLQMGRGAIISLEQFESDSVEILANDHPIARGQVTVKDGQIAVEITALVNKPTSIRTRGATIGGILPDLSEPESAAA